MIYNFSERKNQDDRLEEELKLLKSEYQKPQMSKEQLEKLQMKMEEAKMEQNKNNKKSGMIKFTAAAALIAGFMVLPNTSAAIAHTMQQLPVIGHLVEAVTFRDYEYESERNMADVKVPEIKPGDQAKDSEVQKKLEHTAEDINKEIQTITDQLIKEFKDNLEFEEGYQDIMVDSEVLATTEDYFTLKLSCYQGSGSGYEWNYFYTIDLNTGERLALKDLFKGGTDYVERINKNIKKQMKEQMDADENVMYWLDNEIEDLNFKTITEETSFYVNEKDQVVISFNEGDAAPMYMGVVEFEISNDVLQDIRK